MITFSTFALAQQAAAAAQGQGASGSTTGTTQQTGSQNPIATACGGQGGFFMPMALIFVVFYFMLIRPQQKKQKEQMDWLKSLKKGDEVVTSGGLIGKISGLTESTVTLEVQEKVRLKVLRSHIAGKPPAPGQPGPEPPKTE